jgi:site-specific recombinase XerD
MGQLYVKMATDLKLRRYSPRTQKSYLWAARRFVRHFMRAPGEMGSAEIRQFLLMLHERGESASSIKMYVASLHFLYAVTLERPAEVENIPWPRVAQRLPDVVKSGEDLRTIQVLLGHKSIRNTTRYLQVSGQHLARVSSPLDALGDGKADVARVASARVTLRKRKVKDPKPSH